MKPVETIIAPWGGHGRQGWPRLIILAAAVRLAISTAALADDGDRMIIRSGGVELRSASPRETGKVPVVLIHGMLGSTTNWSALIDGLAADPYVRARFQFWAFGYDSLRPIPEAARALVEALAAARRRFDPEGCDNSFDRVVLVGHSLGGLVAKAAAAQLPDLACARAAGPPPDGQVRPTPPCVGRVIFLATPHRGTPVDRGVVRLVGGWLARNVSPAIVAWRVAGKPDLPGSPTSVDQLTWDNPLLQDLEHAWVAAGVPGHSIIAVLRQSPAQGATDGLVPVASARLEGARSEVVVRAPHICLQHRDVIREIQRILGEHAAEGASERLVTLQRPAALPKAAARPTHPARFSRGLSLDTAHPETSPE